MKTWHLLIVDDEPVVLKELKRALALSDYKISVAKNGKEALDLIRKCKKSSDPVDIVITDVQMPQMDGIQLLKHIKRYYPAILVIVMTGFGKKRTVIDLFRSHCDNYIEKPFEIDELLEVIDETLLKYKHERLRRLIISKVEEKSRPQLDTDRYFEKFLGVLFDELDVESGSLFVLNKKQNTLVLRGIRSGHNGPHVGLTQKLGEGISGFVAQQKKPMLVVSRNDIKIPTDKGKRFYETESFLSLPVLMGRELIGVINFTQKKSREPFTEEDLHFMLPVVEHFAPTLKQQRHQLKLRQQTRELSIKIKDTFDQLRTKEEQLLSAHKFNMDVIDSIPLAVAVLDEDYIIKTANKIFCADFAHSENIDEEIFLDLVSGAGSRPKWEALLEQAFASDEGFFENFIYLANSDENRVLNIRSCVTRLPASPDQRYLLLVIEDITEQIILKERIGKAERLSELGQLVAGVAHEINSPLDGVLRFTNLSLTNINDLKFIENCLHESKAGLERISRIVKSLLQYSRNINKKTELTDINQLIEEILVLMTYLQIKKNINVVRNFNPNLPSVNTFNNLDQVFTNLIKNSYEAMDKGGRLEIETDSDKRDVIIKFKDTGCGISEEVLKNLGKPFNSTKDNGTGLGLSICKDILDEYGATLEVARTSPAGTIFEIRLPLSYKLTQPKDRKHETGKTVGG